MVSDRFLTGLARGSSQVLRNLLPVDLSQQHLERCLGNREIADSTGSVQSVGISCLSLRVLPETVG
jgi:hypothetical protein